MSLRQLLKDRLAKEGVDLEENWLDIMNNLHDIIIYQDLNDKILWANEMALKEFSKFSDRVIGEYCYKVVHDRSQPCEKCIVARAKETGEIEEGEITSPNGNLYFVRAYPVKDKNSKVIGIIRISLNITERKVLKEQLEQNRLRTELFANLSHEFKTPLNLISSGLQLLDLKIKNSDDSDKYMKYISIIKQNNNRLLKLINNLIDITKIDSDSYGLELQNHNIVELIKKIVDSIRDYTEEQGRELYFNSEIEEKVIACDPFNMERIILNLLSNAIKFTDEGDKIEVNICGKEGRVLISVKDTGVGIPKDRQKIIFERFGQADKSFTRNSEGSGIGLSLVKSLVEMHGGKIALESEHGEGSEFIVELPVRKLVKDDSEGEKERVKDDFFNKLNIEFSDIYF